MSVVDLHTVESRAAFSPSERDGDAVGASRHVRFRGWIMLGFGVGSWAVLLKLCGFF